MKKECERDRTKCLTFPESSSISSFCISVFFSKFSGCGLTSQVKSSQLRPLRCYLHLVFFQVCFIYQAIKQQIGPNNIDNFILRVEKIWILTHYFPKVLDAAFSKGFGSVSGWECQILQRKLLKLCMKFVAIFYQTDAVKSSVFF